MLEGTEAKHSRHHERVKLGERRSSVKAEEGRSRNEQHKDGPKKDRRRPTHRRRNLAR